MDRYLVLLKQAVRTEEWDFSAKYLAVCELHNRAREETDSICSDTLRALESLFEDKTVCEHEVQTVRRAAAEAMGSLPFFVHGPVLDMPLCRSRPLVSWNELIERAGTPAQADPTIMGRSLVVRTDPKGGLLVVKVARAGETPDQLCSEALWMERLRSDEHRFPVRFEIPEPMCFQGSYVFRLEDLPILTDGGGQWHPERYAMAYRATEDYFSYPNRPEEAKGRRKNELPEVLFRNALLLGTLSSRGIVHTAPIPLFHNRVQRGRREDGGVYEWPLRGRLDKWLESCAYPNVGLSGVRDFEHFSVFRGQGRGLYRPVGTQLLSLLLVTGSCFRNREPRRIGLDKDGLPVDARDLFDRGLLEELIRGIFLHYYEGFVGVEYDGDLPVDVSRLADRMIEEMGVDRHMEEFLRVADQERMTDDEFKTFLRDRGVSELRLQALNRAEEEISLMTGPHLGAFNSTISLPELIDFVETAAALCMLGRYRRENAASMPVKRQRIVSR
ncbi:MAG: SidJ-related pseudokinase [Deltaproteobacteria bacterium]|nr:SidJ-related pseudokinase [Deltaproteobacteria bacterium]